MALDSQARERLTACTYRSRRPGWLTACNANDCTDRDADLGVDWPLGPALALAERFARALGSNVVGLRRELVQSMSRLETRSALAAARILAIARHRRLIPLTAMTAVTTATAVTVVP